jgi:hypothetical protein
MRKSRRTPADGAQAEKQQQYARLIAQRVSNSEACQPVGINRRTGTRWRFRRTVMNPAGETLHFPPVKITQPKPRCPRYLSEQERIVIADLLGREDEDPRDRRRYRPFALDGQPGDPPTATLTAVFPHHAERAARKGARRPRKRKVTVDAVLAEAVSRLLARRWSPEQVAHELRELFAVEQRRWLWDKSIYQAIFDPVVGLSRPARRRRRRRRLHGPQKRGRLTAMTMIHERPAEVEDRVQAGHWEGDLIMGPGNRSAIGTLIERRTRSWCWCICRAASRPRGRSGRA